MSCEDSGIQVFWDSHGHVTLSRQKEGEQEKQITITADAAFKLAKKLIECAINADTSQKMGQVDVDKEKRVTVGRVDGTGDTLNFYTAEEASAFILFVLERTDAEGVRDGDYYIKVPNSPRRTTS